MNLVHKCSDGSRVFTVAGKKKAHGDKPDRKIFLKPPNGEAWAPSLDCLGALCRIWGEVEENLYPRDMGFKGRTFLLQFLKLCITKPHWSIEQCCYEMKIPGYDNQLGLPLLERKKHKPRQTLANCGFRVILFFILLAQCFIKH